MHFQSRKAELRMAFLNTSRCAVTIAMLLILQLLAMQPGRADATQTTELGVLPGSGITVGSDGSAQYDCGTVDVSQSTVSHIFVLKNNTLNPTEVDRLVPTCGCTTAVLEAGKDVNLPYRLDAGGVVAIQVSVNVHQLHAGAFLKSLNVYLSGEDAPAAVLELMGTMIPPIDAVPSYIDFGRLPIGKSESRLLTVSVSHQLLASAAFHLASTNPDVTVTPVPDTATRPLTDASNSAPWGLPQTPAEALTQRTYLITLKSLHKIGIVEGWLYVTPDDAHIDNSDYKMTTVRVIGETDGLMSADPLTVVFGTATVGNDSIQRIELTCPSENYRQHLRVVTTGSLQAYFEGPDRHIDNGTGNKTTVRTELVVVLKGNAPVGNFNGSVVVTAPAGEQLVLPVSAYVVQTSPVPGPDGQ